MYTEAVQRLRFTFGVDGALRYLSVLDMGRLWERLLRRAALPLVFSQGFNPHPRLAFGAPLPVGYASTMDLIDIYLGAPVASDKALARARSNSPAGLSITAVEEVDLRAPALQAVMRSADYEVHFWSDATPDQVQRAIDRVLGCTTLPFTRERAGHVAAFDLRPLILGAVYLGREQEHRLQVSMVCNPQGAGRPEDLVAALALPVTHWAVCRTALHWEGDGEA